ncbi:MAG TPA: DUF2950 domain-containing protein [Candidatus Acidoferrum sp.]|nr:DUF2950 domain-containing protein [Candidatus Acidoferrum sp.]
MKSGMRSCKSFRGGMGRLIACAALAVSIGFFPGVAAAQSASQQSTPPAHNTMVRKTSIVPMAEETFPSAGDAAEALVSAVQNDDQPALLKILGPEAKEVITSGDAAEDKDNRAEFVQKYQEMHRLVTERDGSTTLYIGAENWPTPIPLRHNPRGWYFDTAAGKQEILYRRIGKNELAAITVCRELVDAQKEYYGQPHDGAGDRQYARKFVSDAGTHDGLFWTPAPGEPDSPVGPLLAFAASEGAAKDPDHETQPFEGYYFRVLTAQGPNAPGGARNYVEDGKMTRGFAFIAYPAEYRSSGVMTFIVNQDGVVYEKDLGPRTAEIAKSMARYDRDSSWRKSD